MSDVKTDVFGENFGDKKEAKETVSTFGIPIPDIDQSKMSNMEKEAMALLYPMGFPGQSIEMAPGLHTDALPLPTEFDVNKQVL